MTVRTAFAAVLVLFASFAVLPSGSLGRMGSAPPAEAETTAVAVIGCEYIASAVDGDIANSLTNADVQAACGGDTGGALGFGTALPAVGTRSIQKLAQAIGNRDGILTASDFQGDPNEDWDQNQIRTDCSNSALNNAQRGATILELSTGDACTLDVFVFLNDDGPVKIDVPSGLATIENGAASDFICTTDVGFGPASTFVDGTTITDASKTTPIVITVASTSGLTNGNVVTVSGVFSNSGANGQWTIGSVTPTTFELLGSAGNGNFFPGGTVTADTDGLADMRVDNDCADGTDPALGAAGNGDGVVLFHVINDNTIAGITKTVNVTQEDVSQSFGINVVGPPASVVATLVENLIETNASPAYVDDCRSNTPVEAAIAPPTSTLVQATVRDVANRDLTRVPVSFAITPPAATSIAQLGLGNPSEGVTGNTFFTRHAAIGTQPTASSRVVCGGKFTGVATIDAAINLLTTPLHSTAQITVGGTPGAINVSALPAQVLCDDAHNSTITASILDGNGSPVADGVPVNFSVFAFGVVNPINTVTASGGKATTVFHGLSAFTVGVPIIVTAGDSGIADPTQASFLMPCNGFDTDGDGLPNVFEAANACLNPLVKDAQNDPDGDGLTSSAEYVRGTAPCAADTDGDGYNDGREVGLAEDPLVYCNIMRADVDGDGAVSILDLTQLSPFFTQSIPPAPARYNQDGDAAISILDFTRMAQLFTQSIATCPRTDSFITIP